MARYTKELRYRLDTSALGHNLLTHIMMYTGMNTETDQKYLQNCLSNLDVAYNATKSVIDLGETKTFTGAYKEHKQVLSDKDKSRYLEALTQNNGGKFSSLGAIIDAMRNVNSPKGTTAKIATSTFKK